jgi:REP element-mobilizing transposase RayT
MPHSFTNLHYHLVFSTKERQPWLEESLRPAPFDRLAGILKEEGGIPLIVNGTADHVHILTKLRPDRALSDVLRDLKARSSGWVHRTARTALRSHGRRGMGSSPSASRSWSECAFTS